MRSSFSFLSVAALAALLLAAPTPARAQAPQEGSLAAGSAGAAAGLPARLQPLFGGLSVAQATQLLGAGRLDAVAQSFSSRTEASTFFVQKGFEYLNENKPDTAAYRFNLAWLLNPQNADAYHGLAVVASSRPNAAPDAGLALLTQALTLAPANATILADLGAVYLNRYAKTQKKKDLTTASGYLQRALVIDPANAAAWQATARVHYHQKDYTAAWEALRKGQTLDMSSLDFEFISELLAKQPDPQGVFK